MSGSKVRVKLEVESEARGLIQNVELSCVLVLAEAHSDLHPASHYTGTVEERSRWRRDEAAIPRLFRLHPAQCIRGRWEGAHYALSLSPGSDGSRLTLYKWLVAMPKVRIDSTRTHIKPELQAKLLHPQGTLPLCNAIRGCQRPNVERTHRLLLMLAPTGPSFGQSEAVQQRFALSIGYCSDDQLGVAERQAQSI
jgi:hypothetical protein